MAYYRIGEELERPRYWLAIGIALSILIAALFFSYGFIAIGVSAHYHPTSDIFDGALTFGAASILFWFLFFLFCLYAILRRFGRGLPLKAISSVFAILWVSGIGYFIVTKEPRPDHFEWVFEGAVYKTDWENVTLNMGTPLGTSRIATSSLLYPACVKPLSSKPIILDGCEVSGSVMVGDALDLHQAEIDAADILTAFETNAGSNSALAIDTERFSRDEFVERKVQRDNVARLRAEARCTSAPGLYCPSRDYVSEGNQTKPVGVKQYGGSSTSSSGGWNRNPVTHGPVRPKTDMAGAKGFNQAASPTRSFSYYFWPNSSEDIPLDHWAVCEEPTETVRDTACTHFEIIGGRAYRYTVPASQRNEWERLRKSLVAMVEAQRID